MYSLTLPLDGDRAGRRPLRRARGRNRRPRRSATMGHLETVASTRRATGVGYVDLVFFLFVALAEILFAFGKALALRIARSTAVLAADCVAHPAAILMIVMLLLLLLVLTAASIVAGKGRLRGQDHPGRKRGSEHQRR